MSTYAWLEDYLQALRAHGAISVEAVALGRVRLLPLDHVHWGTAAQLGVTRGLRWSGVWADQADDTLIVNAALARGGETLLLRTRVPIATPVLPSHTPHYPGADRMERHVQDLHGLAFLDHPDARRWIRHRAWKESEFPLRREFPAAGRVQGETPPDSGYAVHEARGAGVYEIPVGPVHAGIIEPGHFRFQAVGEFILNLEQHLGYVHKGIEKIAEGRDAYGLARLAGRVSGDSTVAHTWAACMAMESAAGVRPPPRALLLRALMCERERIANHLGDIGAVCNDVAFAFAFYQFLRLRELWQRDSDQAFGHRLMMDRIIPGGVACDLSFEAIELLRAGVAQLKRELNELCPLLDHHSSLQDRLVTTGVLKPELAAKLGALGFVGRASGQDFDLRRDAPYAPYEHLKLRVPVYQEGDVSARVRVREEELYASLDLLEILLRRLHPGAVASPWQAPDEGAEGLGAVEGFRGEILTYLRFGAGGHIARFFPRDPSWFTWPALEHCVQDNIVPDFPVCNKSVNGSYSGVDL